MKAETYIAVYKKGVALPVALFIDPVDADEWHANPELYSNCRRRVLISPTEEAKKLWPEEVESEALRLLRILVTPDDDPQDLVFDAISKGQKLLGIKP